ncbi:MAG: hypothetical protein PHQ19_05470, partial [Candidatus Krumholzibacteria bacterium]|nr:hypothetical protein [Candidatus Krumholzibacteria bacterium]
EAAADILSAWKRAVAAAAGLDPDTADARSVDDLLALHAVGRASMAALRGWKEYGIIGRGRSRPAAFAAALTHFHRGTPSDQVRREAVRLVDAAVQKGTGDRVRRSPGGFPHGGGPWHEAARLTSRVWSRLVHGMEE